MPEGEGMSEHIILSKTSDKCLKCQHLDYCDEKRMEACAMMNVNFTPNLVPDLTPRISISIQPIITPSLNHTCIEAQFKEKLEKDICLIFGCSFSKLGGKL